jgi:hypothetical protein
MISIRSLVENLNLFERSKIPPGKILGKKLGLAFHIQLPSLRKLLNPYQKFTKSLKQPSGSGLENSAKTER